MRDPLPETAAPEEALPQPATESNLTLAALPIGARLVLRCRADWRDAVVVNIAADAVTLSVSSPTGRTYRVRRPPDAVVCLDGLIPVLDDKYKEGAWRVGLVRYDNRW